MKLIVAKGINGEIGAGNRLLWSLPTDMKHFRNTTMHNTVVMGMNTYRSLGMKPLPGRYNIVITKSACTYQKKYGDVRFMTMFMFEEYFLKTLYSWMFFGDIFIIGGGQLYRKFAKSCDVLYITDVEQNYPESDTFFEMPDGEFLEELLQSGNENGLHYCIKKYTRKGNNDA